MEAYVVLKLNIYFIKMVLKMGHHSNASYITSLVFPEVLLYCNYGILSSSQRKASGNSTTTTSNNG